MQVLDFMPFLVWYVLPGLNLLTVCVAIPVLVLNLHRAAAVFSVSDLVGAAVLAIVIGFIMDAVKLYRVSPGYQAQKRAFHARLGIALGVKQEDVAKVFDIIRADVRAQDPSSRTVELDHSRWVMINHTSKTFFLGAAVWLAIVVTHAFSSSSVTFIGLLKTGTLSWQLGIDSALLVLNVAIGLRMQRIAYQEADTSDMNYLIYVRKNAARLKADVAAHIVEGDPGGEA
jgi:hypothetical protein